MFQSSTCVTRRAQYGNTWYRGSMLVGYWVWGNAGHRPCELFPFVILQQSGMSCVLKCLGVLKLELRILGPVPLTHDLRNSGNQSHLLWGMNSCGRSTTIYTLEMQGSVLWDSQSSQSRALILWKLHSSISPLFLITEKWYIGAPCNCLIKRLRQLIAHGRQTHRCFKVAGRNPISL